MSREAAASLLKAMGNPVRYGTAGPIDFQDHSDHRNPDIPR